MARRTADWHPQLETLRRVDSLMRHYRGRVERYLRPLVGAHYPAMLTEGEAEYRKMVELSAKMTVVGLACTRIAGYRFDTRRRNIATLFGACCFLGDSFLDDFGERTAQEYLVRYDLLLKKGLFEIRDEREKLFYVILARLFSERDVLDLMLRQAICGLYQSQKADVEMRRGLPSFRRQPRRRQLRSLRECARNRSGHAITMLSLFLVPRLPLASHYLVYTAGALIMFIDDHGDCHYDRHFGRLTYMSQVGSPARALGRVFQSSVERIHAGLPESEGRDLLIAFLYRYYVTRLAKHRLEQSRGACSWTVYE